MTSSSSMSKSSTSCDSITFDLLKVEQLKVHHILAVTFPDLITCVSYFFLRDFFSTSSPPAA